MDSGDPNVWRWIWLVAMVVFGVGEMAVAGSFFLAPFALGAGVAALLAFAGVSIGIEWAAFLGVAILSFLALRPLARRLDSEDQMVGVGATRQLGRQAHVTEEIGAFHQPGIVMLGAERWRAESELDTPIAVGETVVVTEVRGTRVIVAPLPETIS